MLMSSDVSELGRGVDYSKIYSWAFATAKKILNSRMDQGDGEDLVKRLIYDIRGEETPGRFLDKLSSTLAEYRTNRAFNLDVSPHSELFKVRELKGDAFYYVKAAVLSGLASALAQSGREEGEG